MFARIVSTAALAGLLASLLLTAMQELLVTPLIRQAEFLELAAGEPPPSIAASAAANAALSIGFALLLAAALSLREKAGWRAGLLWGAAGYAVFFVAPALGLPPELPGARAAALHERQLWWVATVILSAGGLWLAVFAGNRAVRLMGVALLVLPHVVGAPQPVIQGGIVETYLADHFVRATFFANAVFWLALGALLGLFFQRASQ